MNSTSARKPSKASDRAREEALEAGLRMTVDGNDYVVRYGDVTPTLARELRAATGHGFNYIMENIAIDPDVDLVSEFVWLARRIQGEKVSLESVEVTYADILKEDFDVVSEEGNDDSGPEASGDGS